MTAGDQKLDPEAQRILNYLNEYGRRMADSADLAISDRDWHPSNDAARKLWRCVEAARDVLSLASSAGQQSGTERARCIKQLATPAFSLFTAIGDLANDLATNPGTRELLSAADHRDATLIARAAEVLLPIEKGSPVKAIRDKTSAHVDKHLSPEGARALLRTVPGDRYAGWIHRAVALLLRLTDMNAYGWAAGDAPEGTIRLMTSEPFAVLLQHDPPMILDIEISRSPRLDVQMVCRQLVQATQWMFRPGQARLRWDEGGQPEIVLPES